VTVNLSLIAAYMDAPVNARFNEDTVCCHISDAFNS